VLGSRPRVGADPGFHRSRAPRRSCSRVYRDAVAARILAATSARVTRAIVEHCGDIIDGLVSGVAAEPGAPEGAQLQGFLRP